MVLFTAPIEGKRKAFTFVEHDGRRLLYSDEGLVAVQGEPSADGEAAEWTFKDEKYRAFLLVLCSLMDAPTFPVLPPDRPDPRNSEASVSVLHVLSCQLVDEHAEPDENQLLGLLDDGAAFYITCVTEKGLDAFLLDVEGRASRAEFTDEMRLVRLERVEISNAAYLRAAIRKWLEASLGADWQVFA